MAFLCGLYLRSYAVCEYARCWGRPEATVLAGTGVMFIGGTLLVGGLGSVVQSRVWPGLFASSNRAPWRVVVLLGIGGIVAFGAEAFAGEAVVGAINLAVWGPGWEVCTDYGGDSVCRFRGLSAVFGAEARAAIALLALFTLLLPFVLVGMVRLWRNSKWLRSLEGRDSGSERD